jgi:hypothetical protein
VKKIANKIVDYTLDNKKPTKEKFKVRRSKIRHRVIMPRDTRRNREDLIKSKLEYSDVLELEEEQNSKEKDEDRSLIKKRDSEDDDDPKEISPNNNIMIIKNALVLDNSSSSKSEDTSNNSTPNNSKNTENLTKKLISIKTMLFSLFLINSVLALQEALTFEEEGNKTVHYFSDTETLFKCEEFGT